MLARARSVPGFTLIQLLVWTAVVMALTFLLYPVFVNPCGCTRKARQSSCLSNLKQLGCALTMYVQDWDDTYPAGDRVGVRPSTDRGGNAKPTAAGSPSHIRWVEQLLPYVKRQDVYLCPSDTRRQRSGSSVPTPSVIGSRLVSYGPNRLFVEPAAYGWKKHALSSASIARPEDKYFLAECFTPDGFDLDSIAYMRYPNYDPGLRQDDWSPQQYRAAGRVAWPEKMAEPLTRHNLMTNVVFADGHAKSLRHDRIPDNDGPGGEGHRALVGAVVPWRAVAGE